MKVLITGSEGFIGKHLVKYLKKKKITVYPYDLSLGQDLFNKKTLEKAIKKVDYIIHLAAVGDVYQAEKNPQNALKVGIIGTQNLIEIANKYPIKKIIYASTWEVYGKPIYQPIDENHPCNPTHPYSIAKLGGELIIRSAFNKIPWIILRLGSAYGPNMRPYAVIPLFINKALKKETILLHGGGNQKRQFTHVDDINNAFYKLITKPVKNNVFNIVNSKVLTIKQIAQLIIKKLPTKIKIEKQRSGDVPSAVISSKKIKKIVGWSPHIKTNNGILDLIKMEIYFN
jgi:nucleoside-diphosphate-sugar epimerase